MRRLLAVLGLALTAGLAVPAAAPAADVRTWYLRNSNSTGIGEIYFPYGSPGDRPIAGDWNGDGRDTPGVVSGTAWWLSNTLGNVVNLGFAYGAVGDVPVPGDWDGNKTETPGVRRGLRWYLANVNGNVIASTVFDLGNPSGDIPLSGDWNGDGRDTPGVYRSSQGRFYLSSGFTSACCYAAPYFGNPYDFPIVGDWNGDGRDTVGVVRAEPGRGLRWYLNNALDGSPPELVFTYGSPGDLPVVGDWDDDDIDTPGVTRITPPPAPDPYPTSTWFGGANRLVDTEAEIDTAIEVMTPEANRETLWNGLRPEDKQNLAARDAYAIWGETAPDDDDPADLGSYDVWDGDADVELDDWIPAGDQMEVYAQEPRADASAGPAIVAIAVGCLRYCDDGLRAGGAALRFTKKVVKGKKPRPKAWHGQKPYVHWITSAGSKPSKNLADNLGTWPAGSRGQWAAHHIIAAGARAARTAQTIAWRCGIHPNDARNGIWLPRTVDARQALGVKRHAHSRMHTTHYYQTVNRLLWVNFYRGIDVDDATRCARVSKALRFLKEALEDGSMLY